MIPTRLGNFEMSVPAGVGFPRSTAGRTCVCGGTGDHKRLSLAHQFPEKPLHHTGYFQEVCLLTPTVICTLVRDQREDVLWSSVLLTVLSGCESVEK